MPQRPTAGNWRLGPGPGLCGLSAGNQAGCFQILNSAQERLTLDPAANDEGWIGSWAEMVFSVNHCEPYIVAPRGVARFEAVDVCDRPVPLRNQFFEFMLFGSGYMRQHDHWRRSWRRGGEGAFTRNNTVTFRDLCGAPQQLQVFCVNPADANAKPPKRVLIGGYDANGQVITSQDGNNTVQGEFVTLRVPFATTVNKFSSPHLSGVQKDVTVGDVQIQSTNINPQTNSPDLLLTMEPTETVAWYRRYYLHGLPRHCCPCPSQPGQVQVRVLAKLDYLPIVADTDYLLIQSLEALNLECQSIKMSGTQETAAQGLAANFHKSAIRMLIGQCTHVEGRNNPSINWRPFGSASLEKRRVSMI